MSEYALGILRQPPPRLDQSWTHSCWAAVMTSWSRVDSRFPKLLEGPLVQTYGGKIERNPERKGERPRPKGGGLDSLNQVPKICAEYGLVWRVFSTAGQLQDFLLKNLQHSHVLCSVQLGPGNSHALLIYRLSGRDMNHISYMDPDGGYHRSQTVEYFAEYAPLLVMIKGPAH